MGFKLSWKNKYILGGIIAVIFFNVFLLTHNPLPTCSKIHTVQAAISVEDRGGMKLVGFNGDTDWLKFGKVSPGMLSRKSITAQYNKDAKVHVSMEGGLQPYTLITPTNFFLKAGEVKTVVFEAQISQNVPLGEYGGQAVFCFEDV
jgi:hypothetical protein